MPQHPLSRTLLCAALVAASLSTFCVPAAAESLPAYPFIHVTGSAFQQVMPDIAALDFEAVALDADPAAARAVLDARVGEARALMQQLGMDPEDVIVREVRQSQPKDRQPATGGPVYELRADVHIEVRNVSNWRALAGGLLGKPNLDGFASSFDLSAMDQVTDQLVTEAVQDARRRAAVIAGADGRKVGALAGATPQELKNLSTAMGLDRGEFRYQRNTSNARSADAADPDTLLMVQAIKLRQPVDAIFRIEGPVPAKRK
ncbi:SIMPL domain-containing protein [Massilia sp. 9096]|uniref:SIMPL domain-containing protein n=1 Tax=Massilia sp. 9096 TaxID=1500894 RepID=UPI00068A0B8D|nr:SIMPL domain-containing protein [Massilia sp. 9096]